MSRFTPEPKYSEAWRHETPVPTNPLCWGYEIAPVEMGLSTYLAWALFVETLYESIDGYAVFFDTPTDCLLWLRWSALAQAQGDEEEAGPLDASNAALPEEVRACLHAIDSAPEGTSSAELLDALEGDVREMVPGPGEFQIRGFQSIHEFLTVAGSVAGWRRHLEDPSIPCEDGVWSLSEAGWRNLGDAFDADGGEFFCVEDRDAGEEERQQPLLR